MKKLNLFAFVALICIFFTSCGKSESSSKEGGSVSKEALVGCWVNEEGDPEPMVFNEDGTVISVNKITSRTKDENGNVLREEVSYKTRTDKYKVDGNTLTLIDSDGNGEISVSVEIDGDVLKLSKDGQTVTAKRLDMDKYRELMNQLTNQ